MVETGERGERWRGGVKDGDDEEGEGSGQHIQLILASLVSWRLLLFHSVLFSVINLIISKSKRKCDIKLELKVTNEELSS